MPTYPQSRAHAEIHPFLEVVETERPQTLQKVVKRRIWDSQFPVCGMEGHGVHCLPWGLVELCGMRTAQEAYSAREDSSG